MKKVETELIRTKKTKSVEIYYDPKERMVFLKVFHDYMWQDIKFPLMKAPQILRGLFSLIQRFWRRKL